MSAEIGLLLFFVSLVIVVGVWLARILKRYDEEMVDEFIDTFPGRCMICSHHRYGVTHGHCSPSYPIRRHYCIERGEWFGDHGV